jgi:hypothetical protein
MENKKNVDEFFSLDSFKTLGGSSSAVWMTTNVIAYVFSYEAKWIGLAIAILIAIGACIGKKKIEVKYYAIALLNGLLIYSTAVGISSIKDGSLKNYDSTKTLQHSDILQGGINEASFILFGEAWWQPRDLVNQLDVISYQNKILLDERDSLIVENKKLIDEKNNSEDNFKIFNNKIDSLTKELQDSTLKIDSEKEDQFSKLEAENKSLRSQLSGLQKDKNNVINNDCESEIKTLKKKISDLEYMNKRIQGELDNCIKNSGEIPR